MSESLSAAQWDRLVVPAAAAEVPHFAFPFRLRGDGHALVVDQDSDADIRGCVVHALVVERGDRVDAPDFGVADIAFSTAPLDVAALVDQARASEPRAQTLAAAASLVGQARILIEVAIPDLEASS